MNYQDIRLAIFGAGRWGMNHIRTAASLLPHENIFVYDVNPMMGEKVKGISENITFNTNDRTDNYADDFNAAIVATPAETHYELAKKLLRAGKHVLVEKPITLEVGQAEDLYSISTDRNLKLMVGHVLLYHPAVMRMKQEIDNGTIGKLQYIYSNRLNLGAIRSEENILWSFAPHDISIVQYLVEDNPVEISAHGGDYVQNGIEDTTLTFLTYPDNVKVHIFVSWLHPFKEQRMVVIGDKGMFVFEDTIKTEKLKFYQMGFRTVNGAIEKFDKNYEVVDFQNNMPLTEEHKHFYNAIINDTAPITDGQHAIDVLKILAEATKSLSQTATVSGRVIG
jgi:UDP-2-acetamido-3-amino-2,3-dideoxy-glucuronate N-acetyltransferase